ncbi:aromatic prenyltransferase [Streptomyces sp. enrichment culture]|uniref:aromatic prenyltransferase n=1 Tax=Streptomyces sp. enrichment culture TaxID=1795815 RepID=UPI003F57BE6D
MSGKADTERLHSAAEEVAALLDVTVDHDHMRSLLAAFQDVLVSPFVFNMTAHKGEVTGLSLDFGTVTSEGDPYTRAVAHGLVAGTDHPIRGVFTELQAHLPVQVYGVDYGVTGRFNKAYAFFPLGELQDMRRLAEVPVLSRALSEHVELFTKFGLDKHVSAVAVDYTNRTWNVYFNGLSADHVERSAVLSLLDELGLPKPSEHLLEFAESSVALYPTFGWDSTRVERFCFSHRTTDAEALPTRVEPVLGTLARKAPYTYEGDRALVYAGALSHSKEYYKVAAYHEMASRAQERVLSRS